MPTEPTQSNQGPFEDIVERCVSWAEVQFEKNLLLAVLVSLLLLFLAVKLLIPMVLNFLRRLGITELCGIAFAEAEPKSNKRIESRISICPAPRLTGEQRKIRIPKKVAELAEDMESARLDERFRYCIVCPDAELLQCYAVQFYERVEQTTTFDHYGWVYYATPEDKTLQLSIQNCLLEGLKICLHESTSQERFRAFVDFFDDPKLHTLLVIQMCEHVQDRKLAQIANMKGLSVILFSEKSVEGFDTIEILVKGGKDA